MLQFALDWLKRTWWGLLVAYAAAIGASYIGIWAVIEPLGFPDKFDTLSSAMFARSTYHIAAAVFAGVHIALALELWVRRSLWGHSAPGTTLPFDRGFSVQDAKSFYDSIADQYDQRNTNSLLKTHSQVISTIKEAIKSKKDVRVLDLGGGTGKLVAHHFFDNPGLHWTYVDSSAFMAKQFRQNLDGTALKKRVEIEDIGVFLEKDRDQQYDIIILSLVLTSMDKSPSWEQIAAKLVKGGRFIVADIDAAYTSTYPYYVVKNGDLRLALQPRPVPLAQLIHELKGAGLSLDHAHPIPDVERHINYAFVAEFSKP